MSFMARPFSALCSHDLTNQVLVHSYELLAETGARVLQCLGCGQNGCTFRTTGSKVLKVSTHKGEAPLAEILKSRGRVWPFLPIFYDAWIVDGKFLGQSGDIGVVLREDLIDFRPDHRRDYVSAATELVHETQAAQSAPVHVSLSRSASPSVLVPKLQHARDLVLGAWLDVFTERDMSALKALADFFVWSAAFGLGFDFEEFEGSLAVTNVGEALSDDKIVIRDLGNFEMHHGALSRLEKAVRSRT